MSILSTDQSVSIGGLEEWAPHVSTYLYLSWMSNHFQENSRQVSKHEFVPLMKNLYMIERLSGREKINPKTTTVLLLRLASEGLLWWTWLKENCFQVLSAGREVEWECCWCTAPVGYLSGVEKRDEETLWKCPGDKGRQGTGDTVGQYYSCYHFQYVFMYILGLRTCRPPPTHTLLQFTLNSFCFTLKFWHFIK